jgi:hypothetical protein
MIYLDKAILIKIEMFHAFVLARNLLITVLIINPNFIYRKYRFQNRRLLKIFRLLRNNLFLSKMLLSLFNVSKADIFKKYWGILFYLF